MRRINLLPKEKQKQVRYESLFRSIIILIEVSAVTFLLVFIAQLLTWTYLKNYERVVLADIQRLQKSTNKEENTALKQKINIINNQIGDFQKLADQAPSWANVLRQLASNVPDNIKITSLTADSVTRKILIQGYSPTRESVIGLYTAINQDTEHFSDIDYPLENVSKPIDVPFHFEFKVKEEFLK